MHYISQFIWTAIKELAKYYYHTYFSNFTYYCYIDRQSCRSFIYVLNDDRFESCKQSQLILSLVTNFRNIILKL